MEEKSKIHFMAITKASDGLKTLQQTITSQELANMVYQQHLNGLTALVNIQGIAVHKAFLILINDEVGSSNMKKEEMQNFPGFAQILGFSINLDSNALRKKSSKSTTDPKKQHRPKDKELGRDKSSSSNDNDEMTEPQRRYLFRLLAEKKNLKGEEAEDFLKKTFDVSSLKEIYKISASELIEGLLRGGENK